MIGFRVIALCYSGTPAARTHHAVAPRRAGLHGARNLQATVCSRHEDRAASDPASHRELLKGWTASRWLVTASC